MDSGSISDRFDESTDDQIDYLDFVGVRKVKPMHLGIDRQIVPRRRASDRGFLDQVIRFFSGADGGPGISRPLNALLFFYPTILPVVFKKLKIRFGILEPDGVGLTGLHFPSITTHRTLRRPAHAVFSPFPGGLPSRLPIRTKL